MPRAPLARALYFTSLACGRVRTWIALMAAAALVAAGCGDDSSSGDEQAPPPARAQDFPKTNGKTLQEVLGKLDSGPILASSGAEFRTGKHRVGFALFKPDRSQITNASVAVYVAPAGGGPAQGPYLARYESLT